MWKVVCLVPSSLDESINGLKSVTVMVTTFEEIGRTLKYLDAVIDDEHYVKVYFVGGTL